jgi:hypothetical protein
MKKKKYMGVPVGNTPGQARTANLGIALHKILSYKYRALTDCATGVLEGSPWKEPLKF